MIMQAAEDLCLDVVEVFVLKMRLTAGVHPTQFGLQSQVVFFQG